MVNEIVPPLSLWISLRRRLSGLMILGILLTVGCRDTYIRSHSPSTEEEKLSYGMVGFGFFLYQPNEKNLLNVVLSSSGTLYTSLPTAYITIQEVVSVDHKTKKVQTKPLEDEDMVFVKGSGKVDFRETSFSSSENFYQFVSKSPNKAYVITEVAYSFKKMGGKGLMVNVVRRFPIDPYKSFQDLPIEPKAGEIRFLGTFMATIMKTEEDDPYGVEDTNPSYKEIFDKSQVTPKISKATKFIEVQRSNNLRDKYYGNLKPGADTMEMHFLNEIINIYQGTPWKELAKTRLLVLNQLEE